MKVFENAQGAALYCFEPNEVKSIIHLEGEEDDRVVEIMLADDAARILVYPDNTMSLMFWKTKETKMKRG